MNKEIFVLLKGKKIKDIFNKWSEIPTDNKANKENKNCRLFRVNIEEINNYQKRK